MNRDCGNISEVISELKELGSSFIAMERILDLPIGIINKWESGGTEAKAEDIALLQVILIFPWLLDVAEHGYDLPYANGALIKNMQKINLERNIHASGTSCSFCGKSPAMVNLMVAGPGVNICDGCVRTANNIILDRYEEIKRERFNEDKFYAGIREEILG